MCEAVAVMSDSCWFISGRRGCMIQAAGQSGYGSSTEMYNVTWTMFYNVATCKKAPAGEQMLWCLSEKLNTVLQQQTDDEITMLYKLYMHTEWR